MRIKARRLVLEEEQEKVSLPMSEIMERVRNLLRAIEGIW